MPDAFLAAHRIAAGVFSLSGKMHPISIRDQILRGRHFARRAFDAGLLSPQGRPLVIVGGGAAGVTAALDAAKRNIEVILVEKSTSLFSRQKKCDTRLLHPTQYDWPLSHWTKGCFRWHNDLEDSELTWDKPYYAARLSTEWINRFQQLRAHRRRPIKYFLTTAVEGLSFPSVPAGSPTIINVLLRDTKTQITDEIDASIVLFATGFGEENCRVGSVEGAPFWSTDDLSSPNFKLPFTPRVLISGGGDGALQDFIRVVTRPDLSCAQDVLKGLLQEPHFAAKAPDLFKQLQDHQDCAERKCQWESETGHDHAVLGFLQRRYEEAAKTVLDAIGPTGTRSDAFERVLRNPLPQVHLIYDCDHFGRGYALNRLLVLLLGEYISRTRPSGQLPLFNKHRRLEHIWYKDPSQKRVPGAIRKFRLVKTTSCLDQQPKRTKEGGEVELVIIRHGPRLDTVPHSLLPLYFPPASRQLMPYGFVGW